MYLVEIITDAEYGSLTELFSSLADAAAAASALRYRLAGLPGYVAVRIINLAFALRW